MNSRCWLQMLASCAALALVTATGVAQEKKDDKAPPKTGAGKSTAKPEAGKAAQPGTTAPGEAEMMAALAEAGKTAKEHETLKLLAGKWKTETKCWMGPGDPQISSGTCDAKVILGGRWVVSDQVGTFNNMPFEGHGMWGYDTQKKKFISIWADNFGTAPMTSEGTADPTGKIITYSGSYDCPIEKTLKTMRMVTTIKSPTEHTFEMFDLGPDGKEVKSMEVTYKKM